MRPAPLLLFLFIVDSLLRFDMKLIEDQHTGQATAGSFSLCVVWKQQVNKLLPFH